MYLNIETSLKSVENFSVELRLNLEYDSGSFQGAIIGIKLPEKTCQSAFMLLLNLTTLVINPAKIPPWGVASK